MLRPLGNLQSAINALSDYECDEISIIRPVRKDDEIRDFELDISALKAIKSSTPMSFGGGIRTFEHLTMLTGLPIERLVFSSAFIDPNISLIEKATRLFGRQSIQCILPFTYKRQKLYIYDSSKAAFVCSTQIDFDFIDKHANEVVLYDTEKEGLGKGFWRNVMDVIKLCPDRIVISGGVGRSEVKWASDIGLASVLIDNKTLHKEYSIAGYRHAAKM
jgi:imidazole glycerol phosphate synthase subunit HisF